MKNLVIYLFTSLLFLGCNNQPKSTDFIIYGNAKGIYNGIRVHLNRIDDAGRKKVIDTKMVVNEKFTFEGKVDTPTRYNITMDNVSGYLPLMVENSEIHVDFNKDIIINSKITGSQSQTDLEVYETGLKAINKDISSTTKYLRRAKLQNDQSKIQALTKQLKDAEHKKTQYTFNYIEDHSDNFLCLYLIRQELKNPKIDIEQYVNAFNNLSSRIRTSKDGAIVKLKLEKQYRILTKTDNLEIGKVAPNFQAPTPEGKMVSLNNLKGKVTIIDFWAAWCAPCRKENPNVVRIYNEYHDQGLEIIGVSLDGARTQKDPKAAWLNAIKQDQLTWTHVSNLEYFKDPIAELYNIKSIPATYILDQEGKIAAKNLRGKALELKVKALLNQ